jgi:hypothetical protein
MLKSHIEHDLESRSEEILSGLLAEVPAIDGIEVEHEPPASPRGIDLIVRFRLDGRPHTLVCEVKQNGQPRHAREAVHQLKYLSGSFPMSTPVFLAPYLSEEARAVCRDAGVGYADLEGNSRLVFDTVFIERRVDSKPASERRELKSLFKPKSAQVLRRLLREPGRTWKIVDLAQAAGVSIGHVSNVRKALIERDWADAGPDGLKLTRPDALIDEWRETYAPPAGERIHAYTPLHGPALMEAIKQAGARPGGRIALGSTSAAAWMAPYTRSGVDLIYADRGGWAALRETVEVGPVSKGANLEIIVLKDDGILRDRIEPAPGIWATSPVQTYLDLYVSGERGREAADFLRARGLAVAL